MAKFILGTRWPQSEHITLWVISSSSFMAELLYADPCMILVSLCPEELAAALAPAFDELELEKPAGLTPPPCCRCAAEPERCRVTRGDRRMPAAGADAGDAEEGGASPSGGSLRLLLLLLLLLLLELIMASLASL